MYKIIVVNINLNTIICVLNISAKYIINENK